MPWTDLITEKKSIIGLYGNAPTLNGFILERIIVDAGSVLITGDFSCVPNPMPKRWLTKGFTNAAATINAINPVDLEISGFPKIKLNENNCLIGYGVNISISKSKSIWVAQDGTEIPYKYIIGESEHINFKCLCEHISVSVSGYGPSAF